MKDSYSPEKAITNGFEGQRHRLDSVAGSVGPLKGPPVIEGAEMADTATRDRTERERKLAEIAARSAAVNDREHALEVDYYVSASMSDQIRRSA